MCRILTQSYACEHKVELGRMPDPPDCGGECKGKIMEETVLPASVSVCEPCALGNFSGAIIKIDGFKPATSSPVATSDEAQALPQFLFPVNFPPSPPAQHAVLVNVAPAPAQSAGNQTTSPLRVNTTLLSAQPATNRSAPTATNQSAQVTTGPLQATIPSTSVPMTPRTSASPLFKKGHRRSMARGHVCSLPDYIKARFFLTLFDAGIPTEFDQMYIFAGLSCPKTTALGDVNVELMLNRGLASRKRRGY